MKVDIKQIDIKDNQILVIHVDMKLRGGGYVKQVCDEVLAQVARVNAKQVSILMLDKGATVQALNEDDMRAAGWMRVPENG